MPEEKKHGVMTDRSTSTFCGKWVRDLKTVALTRPALFNSITCGHCRRIIRARFSGLIREK